MLQFNDAKSVACLHKAGIKTGFISKLNDSFIIKLYQAISDDPESCVIIKKDANSKVIGFVAGTISLKKMYSRILKKKWMVFVYHLLYTIANPFFIKKIFETFFYSIISQKKTKNYDTYNAELLAIAVSNESQGQGIGRLLVSEFEEFLHFNGVKKYQVVTYSLDINSNNFYKRCGFNCNGSFKHHSNILNIYAKDV